MNHRCRVSIFIVVLFLSSCASSKYNYNPAKKYSQQSLQKDYTLLREILEAKHPSLYWYTPKEKMDEYFEKYYNSITDSMTEQQFAWHAIAPLIDKIHCGHTSVSLSKAYGKWVRGKTIPAFPLYMKIWNDTMAVTGNLNYKKDSGFKRGTLVTSINGIPNKLLIKYMFEFLPEDGYSNNINYIRLSANFPYYHRNIFGLSKNYTVNYLDSTGAERTINVPLFVPAKDSLKKDSLVRVEKKKEPREKKILQYRSLSIDSTKKFATITLNTFSEGNFRGFFRRTFRHLRKEKINNVIIDLRSNGGGRVGTSTLLTKYISRQKFKVADTLYTPSRGIGPYGKYIKGGFLNSLEMLLISRKNKDGKYHMRYLENHFYKPKKSSYGGKVFILTGGPTFSASALVCNILKGQDGITLLGEETGGGWYGNNGIMIPDIKLPTTGIKVRLPLFRLVQYNHTAIKGTGIPPDVLVPTSYDALLKGYDKKMEEVKKIINNTP
jgi:hypothetical protein